jgi:hypothetical protein
MSQPGMAGPTSARAAEAGFFSCRAEAFFAAEADPAVSVVLLICLGDYDYDYDYDQESSRSDASS